MDFLPDPSVLWHGLAWPLVRLTFFICLGLIVGNLIESLNWTRAVAKVAEPLIRLARLKDVSGASFSLAFFSGVAANTMLSEAHEQGRLTDKELVLSNLFNSLPTYFLHLPTIFFIAAPFIGSAAFVYVGLTLLAAFGRTAFIVLAGRLALPPLPEGCVVCVLGEDQEQKGFGPALKKALQRFRKRLPRILYLTVPIYTLFFILKRHGVFDYIEQAVSSQIWLVSWLHPEAVSIVVFHVAAEFTAGLAAAGALITDASLSQHQVVLALLVGNVLSSPMRAVRHQFPYYAGIFRPKMAVRLIAYSQTLRAASIILVTAGYYLLTQG